MRTAVKTEILNKLTRLMERSVMFELELEKGLLDTDESCARACGLRVLADELVKFTVDETLNDVHLKFWEKETINNIGEIEIEDCIQQNTFTLQEDKL